MQYTYKHNHSSSHLRAAVRTKSVEGWRPRVALKQMLPHLLLLLLYLLHPRLKRKLRLCDLLLIALGGSSCYLKGSSGSRDGGCVLRFLNVRGVVMLWFFGDLLSVGGAAAAHNINIQILWSIVQLSGVIINVKKVDHIFILKATPI